MTHTLSAEREVVAGIDWSDVCVLRMQRDATKWTARKALHEYRHLASTVAALEELERLNREEADR